MKIDSPGPEEIAVHSVNLVVLALWFMLLCFTPVTYAAGTALLLEVNGSINPATSDYLRRGIESAAREDAAIIIIRMDTPGGLDSSMRDIVQSILSSPVPVATFVAPAGARAASAGTYILYASHVAAMAPGTNVGAATPVQIGGSGKLPGPQPPRPDTPGTDQKKDQQPGGGEDAMSHKLVNDATAYLKSLAQMRNRNVEWAERAVREAASITAEEAVELGVIDLVAANVTDLLGALQGRSVETKLGERELNTQGLQVRIVKPDWRTRLLSVIADPNIAYILILIGIYGLIFEFYNPGFILPGVAGAISLLLALFALQVLPVNYAGLGLLILGIIFMVAEAFMPSFGALGIGGLIAFVIGSIILIDTEAGYFGVSLPLIGVVALLSFGFFAGMLGLAARARTRPVVSGREEMVGSTGVAVEDFETQGAIHIHGETWQARSGSPVHKGQRVKVQAVKNLTLEIEPEEEKR